MTSTAAAAATDGDLLAGFPAPPSSGLDLGPITLNFYALCIVAGIVAAILLTSRLWKSRGGSADNVMDATLWAVLLGIIGGRLYHVFSSPDAYFGPNFDGSGDLSLIPQIWRGGLGIWGAILLGAVGVWFACRRYGMKFGGFADAVVPGVLLAQAIGRWGNWFNQELYGGPTDLPWGLTVDMEHRVPQVSHMSESTLFHPTFLYESIWNLLGVVALLFLYRRFQFKQGMLAWTYVAYYTLGRFWIESLRIDELDKSTQFINILGLNWRLNMWAAVLTFLVAVAMLYVLWSKRPRTAEQLAEEQEVFTPGHGPRAEIADGAADGDDDSAGDGDEDSAADAQDTADADGEAADDVDAEDASSRPDPETVSSDPRGQASGGSAKES
ncbi:prolipoprotein diacylglyceryl transferase [Nesterenkonia xinjiangensis]|uniref:Phosphatidylglycerol--prolipoprotein diacylglyceryl transferase n=1 Tax=Nesterenkonia xinjiangensis TaxID=225327 RepID=A0A7Z0GNN9_9MICC|nr:prolipoprotein diacylglyceryl transferase [Nesterenkonia xinjiangensis]NYJ79287.1 prolipoprotein diacylglyceryl transferase [Nesterenkonia xinjiangensis]